MCDFQFVGPGLGALDVMYLLFTDSRAEYSAYEEELLDWYHARLLGWLARLERADVEYPRALFALHYALARAEFLAYSVSRGWVASAPRAAATLARVDATLAAFDGGDAVAPEAYDAAIVGALEGVS